MEDKEGKEVFLGHVTVKLPNSAHLRTNHSVAPQQNNHHDESANDSNFLNDGILFFLFIFDKCVNKF